MTKFSESMIPVKTLSRFRWMDGQERELKLSLLMDLVRMDVLLAVSAGMFLGFFSFLSIVLIIMKAWWWLSLACLFVVMNFAAVSYTYNDVQLRLVDLRGHSEEHGELCFQEEDT